MAEDTVQAEWANKDNAVVQDKRWMPVWEQTVEGCPIDYYIYRTVEGTRRLANSDEQGAGSSLYHFVYTPIPIDIPWLVHTHWEGQAGTLTNDFGRNKCVDFDADLRCQSSNIAKYDLQQWDLNIVA
jgi:hypothetical protein